MLDLLFFSKPIQKKAEKIDRKFLTAMKDWLEKRIENFHNANHSFLNIMTFLRHLMMASCLLIISHLNCICLKLGLDILIYTIN